MSQASPQGVQLEAGALLPQALEQIVERLALGFADVRCYGELSWIELTGPDPDHPLRYEGPLQLLQLWGRVRCAGEVTVANYMCIISRFTDNGIQLLGGKLISAGVSFAEVTVVPLIAVESKVVEVLPQSGKDRVERQPPPGTEVDGDRDNRWAQAIAESRRQEQLAIQHNESDVFPVPGDIVDHRQFGRCTVTRVGDQHITLRKPDGRQVQLGLPILEFRKERKEEKATIFTVQVRGARNIP